jgi:hypothetical protein
MFALASPLAIGFADCQICSFSIHNYEHSIGTLPRNVLQQGAFCGWRCCNGLVWCKVCCARLDLLQVFQSDAAPAAPVKKQIILPGQIYAVRERVA